MRIRIEVPATLANLGSGYDTLGLAVSRMNTFVAEPSDRWRWKGEPIAADAHLVAQTAIRAAERFGGTVPACALDGVEEVPRARGMGSSATARVAGLLLYEHAVERVPHRDRLQFLSEEEGHPDNAWPALLGGLVVCGSRAMRVAVDARWSVATCVPSFEVSTNAARALIPARIRHADAVFNTRNAILLVEGLRSGDLAAVREGVGDRLHQPFRAELLGPVDAAFEAARALGAAPFVGGSGSTLAAFVGDSSASTVADAMCRAYREVGIAARADVLDVRSHGAEVADRAATAAS